MSTRGYAPPLIVDVTWCARPNGTSMPLGDALRPLVLGLYSMLRRRVDADDPGGSAYDLVRRPGVGIPVQLGRPLDALADELSAPDRSHDSLRVVVPLLDAAPWNAGVGPYRHALDRLTEIGDGTVHVIPVVLDRRWKSKPQDVVQLSTGRATDVMRVTTTVAARLAQWLMQRDAAATAATNVTVFVSHSAHDEQAAKRVVDFLRKQIDSSPLRACFDVTTLTGRGEVAAQLKHRQRTSVFLSVRTEHYCDSSWSTTELLTAKELQVPCVTLWMVAREERRASPYGGNTPVLTWNPRRVEEVLTRCLQAWLHHLHFHRLGSRMLALADIERVTAVISRPPELVDLAMGGLPVDDDCVVLYPDPPMATTEARVLRLAQPRIRLATPTTLFAGTVVRDDPAPPLAGLLIAMSLSASPDAIDVSVGAHVDGYTNLHVDDAVSRATLSLVRAGARVAYGDLVQDRGSVRQHFADFLCETVERHNSLSAGPAGTPVMFVPNHRFDVPTDLPVERRRCGEDLADDQDQRGVQALQLTRVRVRMAADCDARVSLGGKLTGYVGRYPGHAEECYWMLEAGKPIYVLGGFGGGARLVIDAMLGRPTRWLDETERRRQDPSWAELAAQYDRHPARLAKAPRSFAELATRLAAYGAKLQGASDDPWTNGLTVGENLRLFESRDLEEISHLLMKGLVTALPPGQAARATARPPGPLLRLFHGSIVDLDPIGAYAVPVVEGVALTGSANALDLRMGRQVSASLRRASPAAVHWLDVGGARLSGRAVLIVSLGRLGDPVRPSERVERACAELANAVHSRRVDHLAVPNLGGQIGLSVTTATEILRSALQTGARTLLTVTVCEEDPRRYGALKAHFPDAIELPGSPTSAGRGGKAAPPITIDIRRSGDHLTVTALPPADAAVPTVKPEQIDLTGARAWLDELVRGDLGATPREREHDRLGRELANLVLPPRARDLIVDHPDRPLDLILDPQAAGLPWELLALDAGPGVKALVPATTAGVRRRMLVRSHPAVDSRRIAPGDRLSVLLVIDPLGDLASATAEGQAIVERFEKRKELVSITLLRGPEATVVRVRDVLAAGRWDVLHYAGHGTFPADERTASGLRLADRRFVASDLEDGVPMPPLVVFNACESGRVRADAAPAPQHGGEPARSTLLGEGLAMAILQSGVRTFIGTFWLADDQAAADFADHLYDRLVGGATAGQAVVAARTALRAGRPPSRDWANYAIYGDTELRF